MLLKDFVGVGLFVFFSLFASCIFSHILQSQVTLGSEFITYPYKSELWTFPYFLEQKAGIEENSLLKEMSGFEIHSQTGSV